MTTQARRINPDFGWQSRYHDHIIRNKKSYERISNYIQNNPLLWDEIYTARSTYKIQPTHSQKQA